MILQETYALSNGVEIPKIGLGTWLIDNDDVVHAVKDAVAIGYRHIDTAHPRWAADTRLGQCNRHSPARVSGNVP